MTSLAPSAQPTPTRFDDLYRRVRATAGARFNAAKRLDRHHKFSQWCVAILSLALIALPLLDLAGATGTTPDLLLSIVSIGLAVGVLALSLLLSMENFAVRGHLMHQCGLALNALQRDLESFKGSTGTDLEYARYCRRYTAIMDKYENHADVDFLRHQILYPKEYTLSLRRRLAFHVSYAMQFTPYVVSIGAVGLAFVWVLG